MAVGSMLAGKLIPAGRRLTLLLTSLIGSIGVGITMIEEFYLLLLGRLILGYAAGVYGAVVVRMINENVPPSWLSASMGVFTATQMFGSFIALISGLVLPNQENYQELLDNQSWRIIFALPLVSFTIISVSFLIVFRYDSPMYYLAKNDRKNALNAIHAAYET